MAEIKKTILWVEDEQELVKVYSEIVSLIPGVKVEFVGLGQLALNKIKEMEAGKEQVPDLIMLDLLLPDINGNQILQVIRNTPKVKDVPVFVLTNYGGEQMEKEMTQNMKAEKYLIKTEWGPKKLIPLIEKKLKLK